MPLIQHGVFGIDRIYTAVMEAAAQLAGGPLAAGAGQAVRSQLEFSLSPAGAAMSAFSAVIGAFIFAGLLAGVGKIATLPDGNADILAAAMWGQLAILLLRIVGWGAAIASWGLDQTATDQWTKVAPSSLATLAGLSGHPVLTTALGGVDFYMLPGMALTAWLLVRASGRTGSWGVSIGTVLGAWATILALKIAFTLGTGIPV